MGLLIQKTGPGCTVQDLGRPGYRACGIGRGGVIDPRSALIANALVGNAPEKAVLECFVSHMVFKALTNLVVAIAGAPGRVALNGLETTTNRPFFLAAGTKLEIRPANTGNYWYVAVAGGFDVPDWLGSASTHLKSGQGGITGAPLRAGTTVPVARTSQKIGDSFPEEGILPWFVYPEHLVTSSDAIAIRCMPGREWGTLDSRSKQLFGESAFSISPRSDRMGYHLQGPGLHRRKSGELLSTGVVPGTVQLLPDGQLIVLMADAQTTGGYPRVVHVLSADQGRIAQCRPGTRIRWIMQDYQMAEQALLAESRQLERLRKSCRFRLRQF